MSDTVKAWIKERRAIHAKATPGLWEEGPVSGLEGCVYLADSGYECVADAMSTDDAGPIVDAHNNLPRALNALNKVLELADELDSGAEGYHDGVANEMRANAWRIRTHVQQAIEGAINE